MKEPIDIMVLTFNRIKYMKMNLFMIHLWTKYPFRLVVIDNGSTDGTREWLRRMRDAGFIWKLIFSEENKMLTDTFSDNLKHIESEFFVTAADDMMVPYINHPYGEDVCWLTMLKATYDANPEYASVNFYATRQGFSPFRKKRWPHMVSLADKKKLKELQEKVFDDGEYYGLDINV